MGKVNIESTGKAMAIAAENALKKHWKKARPFATAEMKKLALTAAQIEAGYLSGELTKKQAKILLQMQANASQAVLTAIEGIGMIAAQDAINSAVAVLRKTVNTAIGVPLL